MVCHCVGGGPDGLQRVNAHRVGPAALLVRTNAQRSHQNNPQQEKDQEWLTLPNVGSQKVKKILLGISR